MGVGTSRQGHRLDERPEARAPAAVPEHERRAIRLEGGRPGNVLVQLRARGRALQARLERGLRHVGRSQGEEALLGERLLTLEESARELESPVVTLQADAGLGGRTADEIAPSLDER